MAVLHLLGIQAQVASVPPETGPGEKRAHGYLIPPNQGPPDLVLATPTLYDVTLKRGRRWAL